MLLDAANSKGVETKEQNFTHLGRSSFSRECNEAVENRQIEGRGAVFETEKKGQQRTILGFSIPLVALRVSTTSLASWTMRE